MKTILPMLMLLALCSVSFAQTSETMSLKVYFHPDELDPQFGLRPSVCGKAPLFRALPNKY